MPTKALINEIYKQIVDEDLKELLSQNNYKVVTAAGDIALEGKHNFILVLTPERLLYLLISKPDIEINYLFIDEAHKLSGRNSRAPFYYKAVDMLLHRPTRPNFIFASPNVPNPKVYLRLITDAQTTGDDSQLTSSFSPVAQIKFSIDLQNYTISVYNNRLKQLQQFAKITKKMELIDFLVRFEKINRLLPCEKRQQTIVYCNGRKKAIEMALEFANRLSHTSNLVPDPELDALSKEISNEIHSDYYLAKVIKQGIAYHIGYLPASIRLAIENLYRRGKITTLFCTSTLLEGVNLPADNLFITDKKISSRTMTAIDFRNLVGRVGRIRFNLYGNVFLISESQDVQTEYIKLLTEEIPEQKLSVESNPQCLKKAEKQYIVEALKKGNIELVKRNNSQTEESYVMMRKFGLILLRDIMNGNDSLVKREFKDILSPDVEQQIKDAFSQSAVSPDDDINISIDQTQRLRHAIIHENLQYPPCRNGKFDYNEVKDFLEKLSSVYKWDKYEKPTLGNPNKCRRYAVILIQWMEGHGLNRIISSSLKHHQDHPQTFFINKHQQTTFNDSLEHRNIVFSDTLEVIDDVILFSISNYFLRFSNEYKNIHGLTDFPNNWYEYVEYGTTNPITTFLQRHGFSREIARYINSHFEFIEPQANGTYKLKTSLLHCSNLNARNEANSVYYNFPEIFIQ